MKNNQLVAIKDSKINSYNIENAFRAKFYNTSSIRKQTIFVYPITEHYEDYKIQI